MLGLQVTCPNTSRAFRIFNVMLWLICLSIPRTHGQQLKFSFKGLGINDGLPSEQVYNMVQDDYGRLWFSTDNGISSYDGRDFQIHDLTPIVGSNHVLHLYQQKDGTILGVTIDGKLFTLNPQNQNITAYRHNDVLVEEIQDRVISSLYSFNGAYYFSFLSHTGFTKMDSNGKVQSWLLEHRGDSTVLIVNAHHSQGNCIEDFTLPAYPEHIARLKKDGFDIRKTITKNDFFQRSSRNGSETLFTYLIEGVFEYNSPKNEWQIEVNTAPFCCGFYQNWVWVGLENKGLKLFSKDGKLVSHVLQDKSVSDMYVDHEGGIWVSTLYSGVFYASSPWVSKITLPIKNPDGIYDLAATPNGNIYIGFNDGWVLQFDSTMTGPDSIGFNFRMHSIIGYSKHFGDFVHVDRLGKSPTFLLFVAGKRMEIQGNTVESKLNGISSFSTMDSRTELLAIAGKGLFRILKNGNVRYMETSIEPNDAIRCSEGYYIASNKGIRLVSESSGLETLKMDNPLLNQHFYQLSRLGNYYVGSTSGRGLVFFNQDTTFEVRSPHGLPSEKINRLYSQTSDTLWLCTNSGIYQVFQNPDLSLRFRGLKPIQGASILDVKSMTISNNQLWIVKPTGLYTVARNLLTHNSSKQIYLQPTATKVNGELASVEKLSRLRHHENNLFLSFQAISFSEVLKFRYKLDGLEKEWHYTNQPSLSYSSIPPGKYNLVVQALLGAGNLLDEEFVLPVEVVPAIYSRLWFKMMIFLFIVTLVYSFFRLRILNYNRDIIREILRQLLKKMMRNQHYIVFRDQGKNIRLASKNVLYVKAANNNVEIYTNDRTYTPRMKLSDFLKIVPDKLEFLQIHRSYIVRLDNIKEHDSNSVTIGSTQVPLGQKYKQLFMDVKPSNLAS